MILHNRIQLRGNFREIPVQIQRLNADPVPTHLINIIRLDSFIRPGIEQHTRYRVRLLAKFGIFVLHLGEYLVQII